MIEVTDFNAINESAMLQDLSKEDLAVLAKFCDKKHMTKGMTVFIENMPGESLFLISQGAVRISKMFAEADEKALVDLGPSDIFGEMAVIDGLPRSATARVVDAVDLISLKKADFEKLCREKPSLALKLVMNIVRVFSRRIRETNEDYRDMLIWSMKTSGKG
ncbi:MAG: cyclic nucleotide-binding domain-containing protein [Deltaproteobacteria bacterium]|jgi:CRP-like cAMP-binding protein|nr:cyclic nucleotide-binding domain-containing protein [Deltaproteobacteria bacterium]